MNRKRLMLGKQAGFFLLALSVVAGCSSNQAATSKDGGTSQGEKGGAATQEPHKPITLTMFNLGGAAQQTFDIMKAAVEKKLPYITLELVKNQKGTTLEELITANNVPDIIYGKMTEEQGLVIDLAQLIKKYNFDVNRIDPRIWEAYRYLTNSEKKLFIPWQANQQVLYYNKSLFDKFGQAYPKDGMTWDETYELAKKVTRTDGGTNYMGFNFVAPLNFPQSQLLLPFYDESTGKAAINTPGWQKYYANFKRFFDIPGNEMAANKNLWNNTTQFYKDQKVAMLASHPIFAQLVDAEQNAGLKWDLVSLPYFPEAPKQGTQPNTNGFGITLTSKYQDEAFQAIQAMLSDEVQMEKDKLVASGPVLVNNKEIMKVFGTGFGLTGKNVGAAVFNSYAPSRKPNEYNSILAPISYKYFQQVVEKGLDINTALRSAEDEMNKLIADKKAAKK